MRIIERVLTLVAPEECLICQTEGLLLCAACREAELVRAIPQCYGCERPSAYGLTCSKCRRQGSPLVAVHVALPFSGLSRTIIESYKYQSIRSVAPILADIVSDGLSFPGWLVTHCPTVPSHYRSRGFDHAKRLAQNVAIKLSLPHQALLHRISTQRQVGASQRQRCEQIKGAFEARSSYLIKDASILLVDDVMTTGATMEEAARTLKKAGAKEVVGLVVARRQ